MAQGNSFKPRSRVNYLICWIAMVKKSQIQDVPVSFVTAICQNVNCILGLAQSRYVFPRCAPELEYRSALVPPYVRKTRTLEAALPWLYLKGVSTGEMGDALSVLLGQSATGLSSSTVSKLKATWSLECKDWNKERLDSRSMGLSMGRRDTQRSARR
ncbi:MAG: hypothetical protein ACI9J2_000855 [Saprospiraceae bacterium]|jgi:hypothetical protein